MNKHITPWLGLASYEEKDAHLFFGRSAEIEELFNDIVHNTQTVVFGPSGTGKTSIIRAGLFGLARKENFLPVYIRLNHDSKETYPTQIIQSIKEELKRVDGEIENLVPLISETKLSLWEFLHINLFWSKDNYSLVPLLVIDQFEEIFTLAKDKDKTAAFFEDLSDLCDNKMPGYIRDYLNENKVRSEYPEKINYRIVLSLREDFLARLEEQANNIPSLRRNRFSLQTINSEQAMEIIMKPGEGVVKEVVAHEIIKKVSKNSQIETSILSLFCNELNKKRIERNEEIITLDLVNEFGDNIIADFYEQIMKMVTPETEQYLETVLLSDDGSHRNNAIRRDVLSRGVTKKELEILQSNRLIRIEEWDGAKRIEFTHDVLCKPAKERREKRKEILKLEEEQRKIKELKKRNRTLALTTSFLTLFIAALMIGYCFCYIWNYSEYYTGYVKKAGFPVGVGPKMTKTERESTYLYFKLTRKGFLNKEKIFFGKERPFTRMETYNAYGKPTTDHSIGTYLISLSNGEEDDDETAGKLVEKLKTVYRWDFVPDANGNKAQEIAYANDGSVVFVFTTNQSSNIEKQENINIINRGSKNTVDAINMNGVDNKQDGIENGNVFWGIYTDEKGLPLRQRSNGADRVKITYDVNGFEIYVQYYDPAGTPRVNYDNAFGQRYEYDPITYNIISYGSIDEFGDYIIDKVGNTGFRYQYDDKFRMIRGESFDNENNICNVKYGYAIVTCEYPDKYTVIQKYWDKEGNHAISSLQNDAHMCEIKKDERGNTIQIINKGIDGDLLQGNTSSAIINLKYDKNGNQICREFLNENGELIMIENDAGSYSKLEYEYTTDNLLKEKKFTKRTIDEEPFIAYQCSYYYDEEGNDTLNIVKDIDMEYFPYYISNRYDKDGKKSNFKRNKCL